MPGNSRGPTGFSPARLDKGTTARIAGHPPVTLGVRIVKKAPKQAISIEQFIELVEKEEARYPVEEQQNTNLMITRLRKIFYGKDSWDKHLIKHAESVPRPYNTKTYEKSRSTIPLNWVPDFDIIRDEYSVTDPVTGQTPTIAKNQEIRLANKSYIDIGHVFAGLDAANYPQMVDGPLTVNIEDNVDATTWVGDLGSVLAELKLKELEKHKGELGPLTVDEYNGIIQKYASPQDMLGNIDAYVIRTRYNTGKTSEGMKVSEILRHYYLADPAYSRKHRYSIFADQIGLKGWNGTVFANEDAWVLDYTDQVKNSAALYIGANAEGISMYPFALGMSANRGATRLVYLFLKALKARIRSEPNSARKASE